LKPAMTESVDFGFGPGFIVWVTIARDMNVAVQPPPLMYPE